MGILVADPLLALPGKERELLVLWNRLVRVLRRQSGFDYAELLHAVEVSGVPRFGPFTHLSLIRWSSECNCAMAFAQSGVLGCYSDLRAVSLLHAGAFRPVSGSRRTPRPLKIVHVAASKNSKFTTAKSKNRASQNAPHPPSSKPSRQ